MKWRRGGVSRNVEDRRGGRGMRGAPVKLGGAGTLIGIAVLLFFGQDYLGVLSGGNAGPLGAAATGAATGAQKGPDPQDELVQFVSFVLDDVQETWHRKLPGQYQDAKLVLFEGQVASACGNQSAAVGPFYCPADQKAYIDLGFYRELDQKFGAPGDFAQAYVLAHEVGHHIQNLLGTSTHVHRQKQRVGKAEANELSVRLELQADCYAGVWAHDTKKRDLLERGDLKEGLGAAAAVGDDTLQKRATGTIQPESWTHGSSEQRMRWFKVGYETGDPKACDTFSTRRL